MSIDRDLETSLQRGGIQFIRILWCDNSNTIRAKAVHVGMLSHYRELGVGLAIAYQATSVMADQPVSGSGLESGVTVQLVPDWPTLTALPYHPTHARVMGNWMEGAQPSPLCPRQFLRQMTTAVQEEGLEAIATFKNQFYLLQSTPDGDFPLPLHTPSGSTYAMDRYQPIIDDMATALNHQGLLVEQYYPLSGPGQQQISILYTQALPAADQQVIFRETIKAIASQHRLIASFLPQPFPHYPSSSTPLHLSLWQDGENLLPDPHQPLGLSDVGRWFMGGIYHHQRALLALTAPIPNSYYRFCAVDYQHRAIQVMLYPQGKGASHFQLNTVDAAANPYLALGAVMAAGLDGVRNRRELEDGGVLPLSLGEAIAALQADEVLLTSLGTPLATAYLAIRQAEWEAMQHWDSSTERQMLLQRY